MKKEVKWEIKELTGTSPKSRKGLYIYVKTIGTKGAYYKYEGKPAQIEATTKYYEERHVKKKKIGSYNKTVRAYLEKATGIKPAKRTREHRQAEQYISKLRKLGTLNELLKKGVSQTEVRKITTTTEDHINNANKRLMEQLIIDKGIINIMASEENQKKLRNRIEHELELKNKQGEIIAIIRKHSGTIKEITQEIKQTIKEGQEIESTTLENFKNKGWRIIPIDKKESKKLGEATLKTTMRKGEQRTL